MQPYDDPNHPWNGPEYHTGGSRYCPLTTLTEDFTDDELVAAFDALHKGGRSDDEDLWLRWDATEQIHVGECSYLKAALTGDADTYLPPLVNLISELIGPHDVVITNEIIDVVRAWNEPQNTTQYVSNQKNDILAFLEKHAGKRAACVAW
jgi:hypothetical protein